MKPTRRLGRYASTLPGAKSKQLNVRLTETLWSALCDLETETGRSKSDVVRMLIRGARDRLGFRSLKLGQVATAQAAARKRVGLA